MPGSLRRREAMAYFGLTDESELERIVIEYDIDADVNTSGQLIHIDADDAKAALFAEHEIVVGYRPDDEGVKRKLEGRARANAAAAKRRRQARRARLQVRVAARKDKPIP